ILQIGFSILPLHAPSVDKIIPTLERFITSLKTPSPTVPERSPVTSQLIAHATASAPTRLLSRDQADTLSELFPSARHLEMGTRTAEGQAKIQKYLDPGTARDVLDFWEDEWLA
ncbi:MAG: hypothetical protein M1823_008829, partial [Watsoniomyces obsoletus]